MNSNIIGIIIVIIIIIILLYCFIFKNSKTSGGMKGIYHLPPLNEQFKEDPINMNIISKYLNIHDIVRIPKLSKEYEHFLDLYKYNPVPISNEDERNLFPNMKTICLYSSDPFEVEFALNLLDTDPKIERLIVPNATYSEYLRYIAQGINSQYIKSVVLTAKDMKKHCDKPEFNTTFRRSPLIITVGPDGYDLEDIQDITVPNCITCIGPECFYDMTNITICIPATVKEVVENALNPDNHYNVFIDPHNPYIYVDANGKIQYY